MLAHLILTAMPKAAVRSSSSTPILQKIKLWLRILNNISKEMSHSVNKMYIGNLVTIYYYYFYFLIHPGMVECCFCVIIHYKHS